MAATATALERATKAVNNRGDRGTSTPERIVKTGKPIDVAASGVQRVEDWPLRQLYTRGSLGKPDDAKARYEAGERFYEHWYRSGLAGNVRSIDLNSAGGGSSASGMPIPESEVALRHRQNFRAALAALGDGPDAKVAGLVVLNEVPLYKAAQPYMLPGDKATSRGGAAMLLCLGLDRLVNHWRKN